MDNKSTAPILLRVLVNPDTVQTIAVTCRCGLRQLVQIPKELHDSHMIAVIGCPRCDTQYALHEHKLHRLEPGDIEEDSHGKQKTGKTGISGARKWTEHYDA